MYISIPKFQRCNRWSLGISAVFVIIYLSNCVIQINVSICWMQIAICIFIRTSAANVLTNTWLHGLLSIERADWPKLHDMFKTRDVSVWQCDFPVGFPVEVSALNLLFINICHDAVARTKKWLKQYVYWCFLNLLDFALEKNALSLKRPCNLPAQNRSN